jgi:hypothetical protein
MRGPMAPCRGKVVVLMVALPVTLACWPGSPPAAGESSRGRSLRDMITTAATREGVDPILVAAVIAVESGYYPWAVSRKGAMGLMQLMPQTAANYGVGNPFDPHENISGGVRHLRDLLRRFDGNLLLALAAYNAGEAAVAAYGGLPPYRETRGYVRDVLRRYWRGEVPPPSAWEPFTGRPAARGGAGRDHAGTGGRGVGVGQDEGLGATVRTRAAGSLTLRWASARPALTDMGRRPLLVQPRKAPLVWLQAGPGRPR